MPTVGKSKTPAASAKSSKAPVNSGKKDINAALAEIEDSWNTTEAKKIGEITDGKYQCKITGAEVNHAKTGRLQVTYELTIASGDNVNRKLWKRDGLDNEESLGYFKAGLARLGVEAPAKISELPAVLDDIIGTFAQVTVKQNGDFTNVYFDKALDDSDVDEGELDAEPNAEEAEAEEADAEEEAEEKSFKKGDKVQSQFGDDWYNGEVKKVVGTKATVLFEDGDTQELEFSELEEFNPDGGEEPEAEAEAEAEPEAEEEDEATCNLTFKETAITDADQKLLDKIARKADFDPEDYETWSALCADLAEHFGVTGDFSKVSVFIAKLKK